MRDKVKSWLRKRERERKRQRERKRERERERERERKRGSDRRSDSVHGKNCDFFLWQMYLVEGGSCDGYQVSQPFVPSTLRT